MTVYAFAFVIHTLMVIIIPCVFAHNMRNQRRLVLRRVVALVAIPSSRRMFGLGMASQIRPLFEYFGALVALKLALCHIECLAVFFGDMHRECRHLSALTYPSASVKWARARRRHGAFLSTRFGALIHGVKLDQMRKSISIFLVLKKIEMDFVV